MDRNWYVIIFMEIMFLPRWSLPNKFTHANQASQVNYIDIAHKSQICLKGLYKHTPPSIIRPMIQIMKNSPTNPFNRKQEMGETSGRAEEESLYQDRQMWNNRCCVYRMESSRIIVMVVWRTILILLLFIIKSGSVIFPEVNAYFFFFFTIVHVCMHVKTYNISNGK